MNYILDGAYEQRLIVLLENEDYNGFNQVMLNAEQFKQVSNAIFIESHKDPALKEGFEMGILNLDAKRTIPCELFDGMNSVNVQSVA